MSSKCDIRAVGPARSALAITVALAVVAALSFTAIAPAQQESAKQAPAADGPMISVDSTTHDFGAHWIGPPVGHTFKITNKGKTTLNILKVRPACGCTVAGKYPSSLAPGETGEFPFALNTHKVRGKYNKSITIKSDDPANSSIKLQLRGECKRYLDVLPSSATFGKVFGNQEHKRVLKVTNNTDEPLELDLDVPADSEFKYDLVEIDAGKLYEIHVTIPDITKHTGRIRSAAVLKTNKVAQKKIKLNTTATIPRRLDVQPKLIAMGQKLGRTAQDTSGKRIIRFTNYGDTPAKVLEATIDDPSVKVTVAEQTAGKRYDVHVEMPNNWQPPTGGCTLVLKTDDKEFPTIEIPITGGPSKKAEKPRPKRPAQLMVGKQAPSFDVRTVDGKTLSEATMANQVTVLDFWAPNCGYCKKQIPRLEPLRKKYEPKGVRFVAMVQTMGKKRYEEQEILDIYKGLGFGGELVLDLDNKVGPLFRARGFPTISIVGKTGKIEAVNIGNIGDLEKRMEAQLDAMLAGKKVPDFDAATADKPKPKRPVEEMVGKPAPAFDVKTIDAKPLNAQTMANSITVLDFWAKNCGHCKKQIPRLEALRKEYESKGVRFVAMAQTMGKKKTEEQEVLDVFNGLGFGGELVLDLDNKVGPLFKARGFPTMVIVGKTGKIDAVNVGNRADLEKRMKGQLDAMLAGKPVPQFESAQASPKQPRKRPIMELVGKPAPQFSLNTVEGKPVSSAELAKHPATVLNFVAPNCGYCKRQLPNVEKIRAEYEAKGVRFINMNQTMGKKQYTPEEALDVFKGAGSHMEFAYDDGNRVGKMFKATGFPTMVVINRDGKVEHVNIGAKADIDTLLKKQLDDIIAGKTTETITTTSGGVQLGIKKRD